MCDCIEYNIGITADDKLIISGVNTRTDFEVVRVKFGSREEVDSLITRLTLAAKIAFPSEEEDHA